MKIRFFEGGGTLGETFVNKSFPQAPLKKLLLACVWILYGRFAHTKSAHMLKYLT
jgi:hypothetical protein